MAVMMNLMGGLLSAAGKVAFTGAKAAYSAVSAIAPPAIKTAFAVGTPLTKGAISTASRVASFGMRHPEATMMLGVGALGVAGAMALGPQDTKMSLDESARLAQMTGPSTGFTPGYGSMAYDEDRMLFHESTMGLVQGLHRGRH